MLYSPKRLVKIDLWRLKRKETTQVEVLCGEKNLPNLHLFPPFSPLLPGEVSFSHRWYRIKLLRPGGLTQNQWRRICSGDASHIFPVAAGKREESAGRGGGREVYLQRGGKCVLTDGPADCILWPSDLSIHSLREQIATVVKKKKRQQACPSPYFAVTLPFIPLGFF